MTLRALFFWRQPDRRYVVRQLCPGRYLNSPKVWRTRCELMAPNLEAARDWLFEQGWLSDPIREPLVVIPWSPGMPGEFQDPDCRPNERRKR